MLRRAKFAVLLAASFAYELLLSNLAVLRIVLSRNVDVRPGIVAYHTELKTDVGITTLANLITLTPGTLTIDVSANHEVLYIHILDLDSTEETCQAIRNAFEKYILELEK